MRVLGRKAFLCSRLQNLGHEIVKLITMLGRVCVVYLLIHLNVGHFVVTSVGNLGFFFFIVYLKGVQFSQKLLMSNGEV